jgi:redox-sensitive bicupin YhaK (pirin superfamily)
MSTTRALQRVITAQRTSDGAGVTLHRSLGQSQFARLDPFLMLDEFGSDRPDEYIAGFPAHPHRGLRDRHLHARRSHATRGSSR